MTVNAHNNFFQHSSSPSRQQGGAENSVSTEQPKITVILGGTSWRS